jgi:hypothetical protein
MLVFVGCVSIIASCFLVCCIALLGAVHVVWMEAGGWKDGDQPSFVLFSLRLFSNRVLKER